MAPEEKKEEIGKITEETAAKEENKKEEKKINKKQKKPTTLLAEMPSEKKGCDDERCPRHGGLKTRGRIFEGKVVGTRTKKTAVVEIQYLRKVPKYERFEKRKSRLHVHIPDCYKVKDGDIIKLMECRKLSKTKSFVIVE